MDKKDENSYADELPEYFIVTDVLDLHGFFPEQVVEMIPEFLKNAAELGYKECKIIHGKGKSKLKWITHNYLKESTLVQSYYDAPPERGGWGATIVKLK